MFKLRPYQEPIADRLNGKGQMMTDNDIPSLENYPMYEKVKQMQARIEELEANRIDTIKRIKDALHEKVISDARYIGEIESLKAKIEELENREAQGQSSSDAFAIRILGQERFDNSPCQANPLELIEAYILELKAQLQHFINSYRNAFKDIEEFDELVERERQLERGLREAMEWNWLNNDVVPTDVVIALHELINHPLEEIDDE